MEVVAAAGIMAIILGLRLRTAVAAQIAALVSDLEVAAGLRAFGPAHWVVQQLGIKWDGALAMDVHQLSQDLYLRVTATTLEKEAQIIGHRHDFRPLRQASGLDRQGAGDLRKLQKITPHRAHS